MSNKKVVGIEIANSSIKAISNNPIPLYYPNTIKEIIDNDLTTALNDKKNVTIYRYNGRRYQVGMLGNSTGSSGKERDYGSELFKTQAAIALAQLVEHDNEELYLIYGVPATSKKPHIEETLCNNLIGSYTVQCGLQLKKFSVKKLKILEQSVGALFSLVYDIYGNRTNLDPRKNYLFDDLGYHTRDIVEVNLQSGLGNIHTTNEAMSDYNFQLLELLDNQYPNRDIRSMYKNLYNLDKALRDNDILLVRGGEINVKREKDYLKKKFCKNMYDELNNNFDISKSHSFPLVGGGFKQLFDFYKQSFPSKYHKDIFLVPNSILANAYGFYIYGRKHYKI